MSVDRDQQFLMPPDVRDWLPTNHLAWFLIEVVEQLDLAAFRQVYRADGHGRAAYDPAMMIALSLYAYCTGVRSSRVIERRCTEDVAYRVLAGGLCPDHVTIARFRSRHAAALAAVFVDSLRLCAEAGLVHVGAIAVDGTKIAADASMDANRSIDALTKQIREIIAEAQALDASEDTSDTHHLPEGLTDPSRRKARLLAARARLEAARNNLEAAAAVRAQRFATRSAQLNAARAAKGLPGKTLRPRRWDEKPRPQAPINLTDPDSRIMLARRGRVQGYNAQLATTAEQIILAAEVTQAANDVAQLEPMITATRTALREANIADQPRAVVADAGYWRAANVDGSITNAPELFIPVAGHGRRDKPRRDGQPTTEKTRHLIDDMNARLNTDTGRAMMRMRRISVEPVIGQTKHARGIRHFSRRGLGAASAEWKLIAATHNLLKLHRARRAQN